MMTKEFDLDWDPPRSAEKSVYHYTSALAFMSVVQAGELWASEASGMNDSAEVSEGQRRIAEWFNERSGLSVGADRLDSLAARIEPVRPHATFVLSASKLGDDANQWRLYADGGRGVAVELDAIEPLAVLSSRAPAPTPTRSDFEARGGAVLAELLRDSAEVSCWTPVAYTDEQAEELLTGLQTWADDAPAHWFSDMDDERRLQPPQSSLASLALARAAAFVKAPGFLGEQERRVVVTFGQGDAHADYHAGAFGIVRHVRLTASDPPPVRGIVFREADAPVRVLPIRSVRLGPAHNFDLARHAVVSLLRRYGYEDVEVLPSEVPLR